jgi:hypothetical protein
MSPQSNQPEAQADWEITPDGLYIATRHFLLRRGYCCANRCRNCPYINWRADPTWQQAPAATIRRTNVSPKAVAAARAALAQHEQTVESTSEAEQAYHRKMIGHYQLLLEQWG